MKIKLAIGIVTPSQIKAQTVFCLLRATKNLSHEFDFIIKEGGALHACREMLIKSAIKAGFTHFLFIDSDMYFEKDAIVRLIERNKDIVGVNYNQRKLPPTSTVIMDNAKRVRLKEEHPDGFTTCDGVATGFMLIKLDVFKRLEHPWFFWEADSEGDITMSEDYWFCKKAKKAGFDIWVDLTIPVKHIGDYLY